MPKRSWDRWLDKQTLLARHKLEMYAQIIHTFCFQFQPPSIVFHFSPYQNCSSKPRSGFSFFIFLGWWLQTWPIPSFSSSGMQKKTRKAVSSFIIRGRNHVTLNLSPRQLLVFKLMKYSLPGHSAELILFLSRTGRFRSAQSA